MRESANNSQTNTFTGGMSADSPPDTIEHNKTLYIQNGRLLSYEQDQIQYADMTIYVGKKQKLTNIAGHTLWLQIPNVPATSTIPTQTNLQIIGWTANSKELILFTTSNTNYYPNTSTPNIGQIWHLDISNYNQAPVLTLNNLIYNGAVNFSLRYQIQAVYLIETPNIKRLYWIDGYNTPRELQIASLISSGTTSTLSPNQLSFIPNHIGANIAYISQSAGSLPVGAYSYCYRLINVDGKVSYISSPTLKINVVEDYGQAYGQVYGGLLTNNSLKGINLQISNIDTQFDSIQL